MIQIGIHTTDVNTDLFVYVGQSLSKTVTITTIVEPTKKRCSKMFGSVCLRIEQNKININYR